MFRTLGTWCHDHRRVVVALWFLALIAGGVANGAVGSNFSTKFELPNVESKRGPDILDADFGGRGGGQLRAPSSSRPTRASPTRRSRRPMTEYFAAVNEIPGVPLISPYDAQGASQIATTGDKAGKIAYARRRDAVGPELQPGQGHRQQGQGRSSRRSTASSIEFGGQRVRRVRAAVLGALGLAFAIVILILAFGSVLAMGLPIGVALAGIGIGSTLIALLSHVVHHARLRHDPRR